MDVFPREQQEVLLENTLNIAVAEALADGTAMLVIDDARGLIENLPASLPRQVAQVGVFQIERLEEMIEAPQL